MRRSKLLDKLDIKIIKKVNKEQQIIISDNVATMISNKFNYIEYGYIYSKLNKIKMYLAKMPEGVTDAVYLYEDETLLINYEEDLDSVSESLLYQCIHAAQDIKNKKGKIKQLGHCTFSEFKTYAIALNETAIQYMVSKIFEHEDEEVDVYGIKAKTFSKNKYPLICNLLEQLLFLSNVEVLVKSTIYSTDDFIIDVVENIGESTFSNVRKNLDDMLYASEGIIDTKRKIKKMEEDSSEIEESQKRIEKIEKLIKRLYIDTQMAIFTNYFDKLYKRIEDLYDIEYYRSELNDYKELLGYDSEKKKEEKITENTEEENTDEQVVEEKTVENSIKEFYDDYYSKKEDELILREHELQMKNELALAVVSTNRIANIFNMLKNTLARIFG